MSITATRSAGIRLPRPNVSEGMSLTAALSQRRSHREFASRTLSPEQVGQLCWAAQGVTHGEGLRAAPSAGALYPLVLLVADEDGVHEYLPDEHVLLRLKSGDNRHVLRQAALDQECIGGAPVCFALAVNVDRLAFRYGDRSDQYCLLEAGHVAQNLLLQATALGLVGVPVGAFRDDEVDRVLGPREGFRTVYLIPVGYPAGA